MFLLKIILAKSIHSTRQTGDFKWWSSQFSKHGFHKVDSSLNSMKNNYFQNQLSFKVLRIYFELKYFRAYNLGFSDFVL